MFGDRIILTCLKCKSLITKNPCAVCGYDPRKQNFRSVKGDLK